MFKEDLRPQGGQEAQILGDCDSFAECFSFDWQEAAEEVGQQASACHAMLAEWEAVPLSAILTFGEDEGANTLDSSHYQRYFEE